MHLHLASATVPSWRQKLQRLGSGLLLASVMALPVFSQSPKAAGSADNTWTRIEQLPADRPAADIWIRAQRFQALELNHATLRQLLDTAPDEAKVQTRQSSAQIALPMPDGSLARFQFVEAPVMAPELAARHPEIKTYVGQGMDDPQATVRFDVTPAGFHAQVLSPHGAVYIDPAFRGDNRLHTSYFKRDLPRAADGFQCLTRGDQLSGGLSRARPADLARSGGNLRTYRLAVAATGEYTTFHGGTVSAGLAAIVTAVNRVTGVYETEVAIRLVLVANNDLIVYTSSGTDPFSNNDPSSLLYQNQATLDSVIGSSNYDIGHVFSTAGGGLASLGVVCINGEKASGETGKATPINDGFYIDYVVHEMGHQFGADHTFNSSTSNCGGNRAADTAYEPGSGSTIMAYAGICGGDNLQPHSDPYFHSISFDEILKYSTTDYGNSCAAITSTGNTAPTVSAGANFAIPQNTPFMLTATGSDPDGDPLTYCWEERDLGASTAVTAPDNGSSPIFRSWNPTTNASRTFPRLQNLLNNTLPVGEIMPSTTRTLSFRVTARDHRAGGGGVETADTQVNVISSAGPFLVTSHDSGGTFSGAQTVTWNVAGTTSAPVSAANVNILLSTNNGLDFPITLMANTPNDGSESIVLPNLTNTSARIKVEAVGNIFFDVGNANFSIVSGIPIPVITLESATLTAESCAPGNGAVDPGETVTFNFALKNSGSGDTTNLVATLLTTNGVTSPDSSQDFGALTAGGTSASRAFSLTATGACGGTITAMLQLQDGGLDLGTVSQSFNLGSVTTTTTSFTNSSLMAIPGSGTKGPASVYPSTIAVAGMASEVSRITITLKGLSHTYPDDLDILLVGPTGQNVLLLSDSGSGNDITNVVLTFDDAAADSLLDSSQILSGNYKPANFDTTADSFPVPAPAGPFGTIFSAFNGLNPNGTWSLYISDDADRDLGSLAQGWELNISTKSAACCVNDASVADLTLDQSVSPTGANVGGDLVLTLVVTNLGPDAASSVTVTDLLPAGLSFVSAVATQGTCTNQGGQVSCALGSLTNNGCASIVIQARTVTAGFWTNTANVASTGTDPVTLNNSATTVFSVNAFPTITHIGDVTTNVNSVVGPLNFTIGDAETAADSLSLAADSSNTNLVPLTNVVFGGSGSNRTVTLALAPNQTGVTTMTVSVSDGLTTTTDSFLLTVTLPNHRPVLAAISDFTLVEGETLTFTNQATDVEAPPQQLTFSLENVPINAAINPTNGVFTWTTSELDGPGTNVISVIVSDDGTPNLSVTQSFTVAVLETNVAPVLAGISNYTLFESELLTFTNSATDADLPSNALTFSLENAPTHATINPTNGVFAWSPDATQAPGTNEIIVIVADDGVPSLTSTQSFTVFVLKTTNLAPVLTAIPDQHIHAGMTLVLTNVASDPDVPPNAMTFSFDPGAPAGATIGSTSGVFSWTSSDADANTEQSVTIRVTDDGAPRLSDAKTFIITVAPRPLITGIEVGSNLVSLTWTSLAGQVYRLQRKTSLKDTNWLDLLPDFPATGPFSTQTNLLLPAAQHFYRVLVVP